MIQYLQSKTRYQNWMNSNLFAKVSLLLAAPIHYRNMAREKYERPLESLLQYFFNYQTQHRGQITHMPFHAGIDPVATDLLVMMMEE